MSKKLSNPLVGYLLIVAGILWMNSCDSKKDGESEHKTLSIGGEVLSSEDSLKVYLVKMGKEFETMDSAWVESGKFHFEHEGIVPGMYMLRIPKINQYKALAIDSEPIAIMVGEDGVEASGGESQDQMNEWGVQWGEITKKAGEYYQKIDKANKENNEEDLKNAQDALQGLNEVVENEVKSFISKYPHSPVSAYVIYDRYSQYANIEKEGELFELLDSKAKASEFGLLITESQALAVKSAIGVTPEFSMEDTEGNMVSFEDYKGKYVLVDFWASWCGPCRKENPNLVAAYKKYNAKGFDIIGVSLDEKKDPWLAAIKKDGLEWTNLSDLKGWNSGAVASFGIKVVPTSFLLGPDGKIIAKNLRGEALEEKLEELLGS
ncbi:redoxin domain-containing protein [Belliella marina]|uniref:Redoxin domain-containing protein n=1 Tax=Belliella marina TaxID=1644146 RepID=A0ABW4VTC5_9BACT